MKAAATPTMQQKFKEGRLVVADSWLPVFVRSLGKDNGEPAWLDDSSMKEIDDAMERIVESIKSARVITHLTVVT